MRTLPALALTLCVAAPLLPARIAVADDSAAEQAAREIAPALTPAACTLAERLWRFVSFTTKKLAARLTA